VIDRLASEAAIDTAALHRALADGSAARDFAEAEATGRSHDVQGTPAWLVGDQLISGLRSIPDFEQLAAEYAERSI
jgi:predicted DsbA family dithiol-disulfide isomerase